MHQLLRGGLAAALLLPLLSPAADARAPQEDRVDFVDARAFDTRVALQILPLERRSDTRDALADGLVEINEVDALLDPDGPYDLGLGALNRGAGRGPVALDDRVLEALRRALLFCVWSENAHGPLGGVLYGSLGLRRSVGGVVDTELLTRGVESAGCEKLTLDPEARTATLAAGSRVDLWGFARGYAVDRAVLRLRGAGATSGWVQIGNVVRAFVDEPGAPGWRIELDATADDDPFLERLVLTNQAIAMVASREPPKLRIAGTDWPPYLDQRRGAPVDDKTAVFVVTETAVDARGLAVALFVQNHREGQFRSGTLQPRPAVKWLLGTGSPPIENSRGWATLEKWTPRELGGRRPRP